MMVKKPPQDTTDCDIVMLGVRRTNLKIDWLHLEKRNEEFRASKKAKVKENLDNWLLDEKTIKDFVQQLDEKEPEEEGIDKVRKNIKYYGYQPVVDWRNGLKYRIIWLHDDYNSEFTRWLTKFPLLSATIPQREAGTRWKENVQKSIYGKIFGNFQQIIFTTTSGERYSVLFNLESKQVKKPFLEQQIGDFANTFWLKAGTRGAFLQPHFNYSTIPGPP